MLILAIDTSCDDTSAAVVRGRQVLSNVIVSQTELHAPYGGVFPTVAKQAHRDNLAGTVADALSLAKVAWNDIEMIAVTQGPGLAPSLEVGITGAKQLATEHNLPLVPVNHLEGHLWSVWADVPDEVQPVFPALGLIISGGNTQFVLVEGVSDYTILGETIDDAAGEALDKVGRMLGLGYPAGAQIEELAKIGNPRAYHFPLPMTESGDYNLSFAGMKTAAKNLFTKLTAIAPLSSTEVADFCASFQTAIFRAVTYKLEKILKNEFLDGDVDIWLGGGVAANNALRAALGTLPGVARVLVPANLDLCRDNAGMIGVVASEKHLVPNSTFERKPIWPLFS